MASSDPSSNLSRRSFLQSTALAGASTVLVVEAGAESGASENRSTASVRGVVDATLRVNGEYRTVPVEPRTTLVDALRDRLGLTGVKVGCNHGQCGACTVIVDGQRVLSCLTLALSAQGRDITTVEGIATADALHPVQSAFVEHDGFQCGYCTPGQVCSGVALVEEVRAGFPSAATEDVRQPLSIEDALSPAEVRERMSGNLCRCAAYNGIVAAVRDGVRRVVEAG